MKIKIDMGELVEQIVKTATVSAPSRADEELKGKVFSRSAIMFTVLSPVGLMRPTRTNLLSLLTLAELLKQIMDANDEGAAQPAEAAEADDQMPGEIPEDELAELKKMFEVVGHDEPPATGPKE